MAPNKQLTIFVMGATGVQGGAVARQLLSAGHKVRALVRDPSKAEAQELASLGAVMITGDFDNVQALEEAAHGSDGVFLNTKPNFPNNPEIQHAGNIIIAAKKAVTVKTLIYSSVILTGKQQQLNAWNELKSTLNWVWEAKDANQEQVRNAGFEQWTILQPAWLTTNFVVPVSTSYWPELAKEHVLFHGFDDSTLIPLTAPIDIGEAALAAFEASAAGSKSGLLDVAIPLVSDELTIHQIADEVSATTGIKVEAKRAPEEDLRKSPRLANQLPYAKEERHNFGQTKDLGLKSTTFKEFLAKNKDAAVKALQS